MKFGKKIQALAVPEWSTKFLNYKGLKRIIKKTAQPEEKKKFLAFLTKKDASPKAAVVANVVEEPPTSSNSVSVSVSEPQPSSTTQADLVEELQHDINKIHAFFDKFSNQGENVWASRRGVELQFPEVSKEFLHALKSELLKINEFYSQKEKECEDRLKRIMDSLERLHASRSSPTAGTSRRAKQNNLLVKNAFQEQYKFLTLLQNYRQLNQDGFRKILKKFDKNTRNLISHDVMDIVNTSYFVTSRKLEDMMRETENTVSTEFFSSNRKKTKKFLVNPVLQSYYLQQKLEHASEFDAGLWSGVAIVLTFLYIFTYFFVYIWIPNKPKYAESVFALYRVLIFPIILSFFVGLNVRIWSRANVNYILIFEWDTRHIPSRWDLLRLSLVLYSITIFSSLLFIFLFYLEHQLNYFNSRELLWILPIVSYGIVFLWLICPFKIFYFRIRLWIAKTLFRVIVAPFAQVKFKDFWMADQITSLSDILFTAQFILCLSTPTFGKSTFCSQTISLGIPFLNSLPQYLRLMQCIRRFNDSPSIHPHLTNGLKYSMNIVANVLIFVDRGILATPGWNHARTAWIIVRCISTIYSYFWDIYMDFGLWRGIRKQHVKAPFLRKDLLFRPGWYYLAMIENLAMRLVWVAVLIIQYYYASILAMEWAPFLITLAEIFRRFVWNIFRVENEHLNNVYHYKAVREIPLPFEKHSTTFVKGIFHKCCKAKKRGPAIQPVPSTDHTNTRVEPITTVTGESMPHLEEMLENVKHDQNRNDCYALANETRHFSTSKPSEVQELELSLAEEEQK